MMIKSYAGKSVITKSLLMALLFSCNIANSADRREDDEAISCVKYIFLVASVIATYGTTFFHFQQEQRVEQDLLAPICDNPVGGFTLGSTLPVPLMQATQDGNDCECWKLDFVQCRNGSLSSKQNLFSDCYYRKKTATPVVRDSTRDQLYQSALKLNATGSKNVVIWKDRGCRMIAGEYMKSKED